jgi:hypothetical protein
MTVVCADWRAGNRNCPPISRLTATGNEPLLAITIDNAVTGQRYQGLVPVDDDDPGVLFERYFRTLRAVADTRVARLRRRSLRPA